MNLRYPVTLVLIAVNLVVFAFVAIDAESVTMQSQLALLQVLKFGANLNAFTLGGEPWRLVASMFLHIGIFHLVVNLYGLFAIGRDIEQEIGSLRFLILYFICGLIAGVTSLLFNVFVISAGASGALFGLCGYGIVAGIAGSYHDREKLQTVLINFAVFVTISIFIANVMSVDTAGHIGGAFAGAMISFCHYVLKTLRKPASMAVVMIFIPGLMVLLPTGQVEFYRIVKAVMRYEAATNHLLQSDENDFVVGDSLRKIYEKWSQLDSALHNISHIPGEMQNDTSTMSKYISLRAHELSYKIEILKERYIYQDSAELIMEAFRALPPLERTYFFDFTGKDESENPKAKEESMSLTPVKIFYDKDWKETADSINATYYRIGTRDSIGRWQGRVWDYYADGDIQMKGAYLNGLRNGIFIYYTDHHTYSSAGRYIGERLTGRWEYFHWNGHVESEIMHEPEFFVRSVWDSLGNLQVANGKGEVRKWYNNGALAETGNYSRGDRDGYWYGYYSDGKPRYKELFRKGRLTNGISIDKQGKRYAYDYLSQLAFPVNGMERYREYLSQSKKRFVTTDHGTVKVIFTVGTDGSLWDFVILQSVSSQCDEEAIRLVKEGPAWRPAYLHGYQKVQSEGYMEVVF